MDYTLYVIRNIRHILYVYIKLITSYKNKPNLYLGKDNKRQFSCNSILDISGNNQSKVVLEVSIPIMF